MHTFQIIPTLPLPGPYYRTQSSTCLDQWYIQYSDHFISDYETLQINKEKTKCVIVERKNSLKKNKIGHLKIKNYKFERGENFKYLGVILNEDNNHQIDFLQERIKNANKTYFML